MVPNEQTNTAGSCDELGAGKEGKELNISVYAVIGWEHSNLSHSADTPELQM